MTCELSGLTTDWLAVGLLLAAFLFAWLMRNVKQRLREAHPMLWSTLDDAALPLRKRLINGARLFAFILLGRYTFPGDRHLTRDAMGARVLLLCFLVGAVFLRFCV